MLGCTLWQMLSSGAIGSAETVVLIRFEIAVGRYWARAGEAGEHWVSSEGCLAVDFQRHSIRPLLSQARYMCSCQIFTSGSKCGLYKIQLKTQSGFSV